MSSGNHIPAIRGIQFDNSGIGELESSVNLFRGDINYTHTLFTLPGRGSDESMEVQLSLLYQSNVHSDVTTWNRDAPTSVIGLGWTFPLTYIELDDQGSPTPGWWTYTYWANGSSNVLVPEPGSPFLFSMPSDLADELENGAAVTANIRSAFAAKGIGISSNAIVTNTPADSTSWTLTDDDNQQIFTLVVKGGSSLDAYDGGQSFQLQSYQFWKILYYAKYERWVVIDESGRIQSFGGKGDPTEKSYATSTGNSIEWAVRWTGSGGGAVWSGPSSVTQGQQQYARAWHLASTRNIWGDRVTYAYNGWPNSMGDYWQRDQQTGLIPSVEQLVGADGLPYTKACYLTDITDVFGRQVQFHYADKQWSSGNATDPREYADPHKATPDTTPNSYQDRYETKYLKSIDVCNTDGATLFTVALNSSVKNVTNYGGSLQGDTYKRYLNSIVLSNPDGKPFPSMTFDYYTDSSGAGASLGALKSITYPQGSTATYSYTQQDLAICDRSVDVAPPEQIPAGGIPRVWFGPDYAVTTWYSPAGNPLSLVVYTWLGRWLCWQIDPDDPTLFDQDGGIDFDSLDVLIGSDFFALHFQAYDQTNVFVFRQDTTQPGQWVPASIDGTLTKKNVPTLSYPSGASIVTLEAGDNFLIVASCDTLDDNKTTYDRITWRWTGYDTTSRSWTAGGWEKETISLDSYACITAFAEYYFTASTDSSNKLVATITYLDQNLEWQSQNLAFDSPSSVSIDRSNFVLAPGPSFIAGSYLLGQDSLSTSYALFIVQWNEHYQLAQAVYKLYDDQQEPSGEYLTSWIPTVVDNGTVACAAHVLRFNGQTWLEDSTLYHDPSYGEDQRFAYGPDYTLKINDNGSSASARLLAFDPNDSSDPWQLPASPAQPLPDPTHTTSDWPSAGQTDYLALGPYLYFRGTETNWATVIRSEATANLQELVTQSNGSTTQYVNSQSVINQAPNFIAFEVDVDDDPTETGNAAVVVLKNGRVKDDKVEMLPQQKIAVASDYSSSALPSGAYPGGPSMFASYPATANGFDSVADLDNPKFSIHRYAGGAIEGKLVHYAVTGLSISDGFEAPVPITYFPDPKSAACDPDGTTIKYYSSCVYPGTDDFTKATYGSVVNTYLNGLILTGDQVSNDDNFYDMMDGLLKSVTVHDSSGKQVSQKSYTWQAYAQRTIYTGTNATQTVSLKGAFVCQTQQTKSLDGVSAGTKNNYVPDAFDAPYSGQPVSTTSITWGGDGKQETFVNTSTCGSDLNDDAWRVLHILNKQVQSITTWQHDNDASSVTARAKVTTYDRWAASTLGSDVTVPAAEADFTWMGGSVPFLFTDYTPGDQPDGWLRVGRILSRTSRGLICEAEDGCGVTQSIGYGKENNVETFPVAQFVNASLAKGESAYWGFESYEPAPDGFELTGCQSTTDDAHSGAACLSLPDGKNASLSLSVTPQAVPQIYVLGFWYKTPSGFTPTTGTGWTISLSFDGGSAQTTSKQFANTDGVWAYWTIGIDIAPPGGTRSVKIIAMAGNAGNSTVLLDDVFIAPLTSHFQARTFDTDYHLMTASLDAGGHTSRTIYDRFQRTIVRVGPDEQTMELNQRFLSREGSSSDSFSTDSPNAEITLHPAAGGVFETFSNDEEWRTRWTASDPTAWTASSGSLQHDRPQSDTLTWNGWSDPVPSTAALFFDVVTQDTLADSFGIRFGNGLRITYEPNAGYKFTDQDGDAVQEPLVVPPAIAEQWLLVLGCSVVLFFGDGQLIFSKKLAYGSPGAAIETGANLLTFRHLTMPAEPRLGLSHNDATGRMRQAHQLLAQPANGNSNARVCQIIYDALDRKVATTRTAPANYGKDSAVPLMHYRPNFVDVDAFLSGISASPPNWTMTGDVADYYGGEDSYPYRGQRYEDTPLNRVIEESQPGKELAIGQGKTVSYSYGAYTRQQANYYKHIVTSPVGTQTVSIVDTAGRQVARSLIAEGKTAGQAAGEVAYTGNNENYGTLCSLTAQLPNAFTTGPQSDPEAYVSVIQQDPQGRTVAWTDPSTGTTSYIYSPTRLLRFVQPALDPGDTYFIYYRYDALGRVVEEGTIAQAWDTSSLMAKAADLGWPDASVKDKAITRTYCYDGDGNDPTKIGQKTQVVTYNPAPTGNSGAGACPVTETFGYDQTGQVASVAMSLSGDAGSRSGLITYGYNNMGEVTCVTYPEDAPLDQIHYAYDDQGQVTSIGTSSGATDVARYGYTMDGQVETEVRNNGTLNDTVQYTPAGWVRQIQVAPSGKSPCFEIGYQYNADSTVLQRTLSQSDVQSTFTYDGQRRLVDGGAESIDQYDSNGNIWQATQDSTLQLNFQCASGSDRLATATLADGSHNYSYHADGWLGAGSGSTSGNGLSVERDITLARTRNIIVDNGMTQVRFAYGGSGQRALKQVSGDAALQRVYFHGTAQQPLALCDNNQWAAFVYGPAGLVAFTASDNGLYVPLKDFQQTVWTVLDASNDPVAQLDYLPFGTTTTSGTKPDILEYRFMGQEWDPETGLYNFRARLYDPALRRFYSPDAARQFASPYVFVGDDPLRMVDPSGNISLWAQIGLGVTMIAVIATGTVLAMFTGGTSEAVADAADAALIGEFVGAEIAEDAAEAVAASGAEVASSAGADAAGDVAASSSFTGKSVKNIVKTGVKTTTGQATKSAGLSGLQYDISHGRDFSAKGFFESMGIGATSGLIFGAITGTTGATMSELRAITGPGSRLTKFARASGMVVVNVGATSISSAVSQILTNISQDEPWNQGVAKSFGTGFAKGAFWSGYSGGMGKVTSKPMTAELIVGTTSAVAATTSTIIESIQLNQATAKEATVASSASVTSVAPSPT